MNNITFVTALYNINRWKKDGRTFDKYLKWFKNTLQINAPLVIFIPDYLEKFVLKNRPYKYKTKIIIQDFVDIPYYNLVEIWNNIHLSESFKNHMENKSLIWHKLSWINALMYSKFKWLSIASESNFFNTNNFIWIDWGISRFFYWLNIKNLKLIADIPTNKFVMCASNEILNLNKLDNNYFWTDKQITQWWVFWGNKYIINKISNLVEDYLFNIMIPNNSLNNEQILLTFLAIKYPEYFEIYIQKYTSKKFYWFLTLFHSIFKTNKYITFFYMFISFIKYNSYQFYYVIRKKI